MGKRGIMNKIFIYETSSVANDKVGIYRENVNTQYNLTRLHFFMNRLDKPHYIVSHHDIQL